MREGYIDFLKGVADEYQPDRIVHIGDLVDWHAISYHERSPSSSNATQEYQKALIQVKELNKVFPKVDWLIGNHDCLTERQATTAGLPSVILKSYNHLWETNWTVHPRYTKLKIDGVLYSHGDSGSAGKFAALNQAKENFRSTVIGHHHSLGGVNYMANKEFRVFGMSVGCGINVDALEFDYGRKFASKPVLGCGAVIDGKRAFFEPWLLKSR
jgi:metallophosphoesterase superfamily enzyme